MKNRYLVVTHSADIGHDEKMDFPTMPEAIAHANLYRNKEEYAAVYDYKTRTAVVVFGNPLTEVFSDTVKVLC